jgi:DNA invertase Pin-like site-specific DNA recombinase
MEKIVLFCRVSSVGDRQNYDRQINDLTQLANSRNYEIKAIFAEKISGAKKNHERKELLKMIEYVNQNQISKVCVTEISRLGRDTLQVLEAIETLNQHKISLYIQNYNIETLTSDKEINPMTQFLVTLLAEISRMERNTTLNRLSSGYNNYRMKGGTVGRKSGFHKTERQMSEEYAEEIKMLKKGYCYQHISQITNTNKNTLTKLRRMFVGTNSA